MGGFAGFEGGVAFVDLVPVGDVPPGGEIFGAAVVVFQIVGVLPDVVAEDGVEALGDWVVLIGGAEDLHFAVGFAGEPDPSAAELLGAGVVEFGLEIFEVAESFVDHVGDGAGGIAAAFGLHNFPEHGVVDVASGVVAHGGADVVGDRVQVADEIFGGLAGEFGMLLEGGIQVFHVGAVVHVVVQSHSLLIDDGFERVVGVRECG
ncbi:putative Phosphomannomutase [Acidobacteriia bacterium SbA2]|nr:putative Phosphomannomutase [Acidobacteriia bacterium SbA2]